MQFKNKIISTSLSFAVLSMLLMSFPGRASAVIPGLDLFDIGALLIIDAFTCDVNIIWGCDSHGNALSAPVITPTAVKVNGSCGSANGTYGAKPTANLCLTGSNSNVLSNAAGDTWTWICLGTGGGTNSAQCKATKNCVPNCQPANTICVGQGGQPDGCGGTCALGTKTDGVCCVDTTWSPALNTKCTSETLTQTSDHCAGRTRVINGTRACDIKPDKWKEVQP